MASAYYSVVIDHSASDVWATIRRFDHYGWAGVEGETIIEDGKNPDQVGAIRRFLGQGNVVRQILRAHSDVDRSYSYAFCEAAPFAIRDYEATIRVTPVTEDNRAFVEWRATFDCPLEERDRIVKQLEESGFAKWLTALRAFMAKAA